MGLRVCGRCGDRSGWPGRSAFCVPCREQLRADRLCERCGVGDVAGGGRSARCGRCLEVEREARRVREAGRRAAGRCRCGAALEGEGSVTCAGCRRRVGAAQRRFRGRVRAAGGCNHCLSVPAEPGASLCEGCRGRQLREGRQLRDRCLVGYGHRCWCCGERRRAFLELDHVSPDWAGQGRGPGERSTTWYRQLIADGFPDGVQVACGNCNWQRRLHGGVCRMRHGQLSWRGGLSLEVRMSGGSAQVRSGARLRGLVLEAYGGQCVCCGLGDRDVLDVDHVGGGGREHRRVEGLGSSAMLYRWLRDRGFPSEGFRLLCRNCNRAVFVEGWCPHRTGCGAVRSGV